MHVILVANHYLSTPRSTNVQFMQVSQGFDVADNEIVKRIVAGDLLISSDIPLADEVIEKNALVLTPRGEQLTKNNIKAKLNMRDFMETMRSSGIQSGGPPPLNTKDKKAFADKFDRIVVKMN